jgi:hypothetical protein
MFPHVLIDHNAPFSSSINGIYDLSLLLVGVTATLAHIDLGRNSSQRET